MGQYLSSPLTEKESIHGHNDHFAFGLSAMQGWRVSMEDAHISELHLDPDTALFSVFDGHGGKAVAKFCAKHMARELLALEAYKAGDLGRALSEVYYRMDELLDTETGKAELNLLVDSALEVAPSKGLFSDVESQLPLEASSPKREAAPQAPVKQQQQGGTGTGAASPAPRPLLKRVDSTEEFRRSALSRQSMLPANAAAEEAAGTPLDTITSGLPAEDEAPLAERSGDGTSGSGDEETEVHQASGTGCTAVSALIRHNQVVVANTGDSRCVLSRRGEASALTLDHKPIIFEEAQRIIKAGGFVRDNRINGALNVSRTIGDLDFKRNTELPHTEQMVVATPDIETVQLREGDEFLILACDGIWDVLTNQEAVDFVRKRIKQGQSLLTICEAMCDHCLAPNLNGLCRGADNMSVIVVLFKKHANLDSMWARCMAWVKRHVRK